MDGSVEQLLTVDPAALSYDEQLDHLVELHALEARVTARKQHALAAIDEHEPDDVLIDSAKEWQRDEVACLLTIAPGFAATLLGQATRLVRDHPRTLRLVESGVLSHAHARALLDQTVGLDAEVAGRVEAEVLRYAGLTTVSEFRAKIRRAILRHDTRAQDTKTQDARSRRRVATQQELHGMSWLSAFIEDCDAQRIMARLDAVADHAPCGDTRTADQRRADAFVALLTGTEPSGCSLPRQHGRQPAVSVLIDYATLVGAAEGPGQLGQQPIGAATARELAFDPSARWRWQLVGEAGQLLRISRAGKPATTPDEIAERLRHARAELLDASGRIRPIAGDPTRYRPSAELRDTAIARDRTCRFPTCRRRAEGSEIDHIVRSTAATRRSAMCTACVRATITSSTRQVGTSTDDPTA